MLLGCAAALAWHPSYLFAYGLLWMALLRHAPTLRILLRKCLVHATLLCLALLYTRLLYPPPSLVGEAITGIAELHIHSVKPVESFFTRSLLYKGLIHTFRSDDTIIARNLPCHLYLSPKQAHPAAHCAYLVAGTLHPKAPFLYALKPDKTKAWRAIPKTYSFAQMRYKWRCSVDRYIHSVLHHPRASSLMSALIQGEIEDKRLAMEFGRLGMQHVLGISGFQFALLAVLFGMLLRRLLPDAAADVGTLLLLTLYFFCIGNSPPVTRAYVAICIYLVGRLCNLRCSGLNALGVGLMLALAIDPLVIQQIGFQLSFLCTLAILLLYPLMDRCLQPILPTRPYITALHMPVLDRVGYILCTLLRKSIALNASVHLFALPMLLLLFHKFPLFSLLYNLFFPFWITVAYVAFLCTSLLHLLIPPLGLALHTLNSHLLHLLIECSSNPPAPLDFVMRTRHVGIGAVVILLTLLFHLCVWLQARRAPPNGGMIQSRCPR